MIFFFKSRKTYPGFGCWAAAFSCFSGGFILLALRGAAPDWAVVLAGNCLLAAGMALVFDGLTLFSGRQWRISVNGALYAMALACICVIAYYTYAESNPAKRIAAFSMFRFVANAFCVVALVSFWKYWDAGTFRLLTFMFAVSAVLGALRALHALTLATAVAPYDDPAYRLFMLLDIAVLTAMSFCFFVLTHMRIEQDLERERAAVERASRTDKLTGLLNRSYFESELERRLREADRFDDHLSLLIMDIDHFKNINDRFGHPVGDEVLREMAARAAANFRSSDLLCRWGGEEFVCVLRGPVNAAVTAAENLRAAVLERPFAMVGSVSLSVGIAERRANEDFHVWLSRADHALYRAKANGRDRIELESASHVPIGPLLLRWNPVFLTGDAIIDRQHKGLFEKGALLLEKCAANDADGAISLAHQLLEDADQHYRYEEYLLDTINYSSLDQHCEQHRRLREQGAEVLRSVVSGTARLGTLAEFVISDLVLGHVAEEDIRYIDTLKGAT
jgi:diguanylate cyclase (GGDEF)-like protein/hemerythrin-like metal-binding protein